MTPVEREIWADALRRSAGPLVDQAAQQIVSSNPKNLNAAIAALMPWLVKTLSEGPAGYLGLDCDGIAEVIASMIRERCNQLVAEQQAPAAKLAEADFVQKFAQELVNLPAAEVDQALVDALPEIAAVLQRHQPDIRPEHAKARASLIAAAVSNWVAQLQRELDQMEPKGRA